MKRISCLLSRWSRRLARNEEGVAAIEFGVIGSLLAFMMVMATDLGFAMHHRSQMEAAVRAGLQRALQTPDDMLQVQTATLAAADLPSSPPATATAVLQCTCSDGTEVACGTAGNCGALTKMEHVELSLAQNHVWLFGVPGLPNPMPFSITKTMRVGD